MFDTITANLIVSHNIWAIFQNYNHVLETVIYSVLLTDLCNQGQTQDHHDDVKQFHFFSSLKKNT